MNTLQSEATRLSQMSRSAYPTTTNDQVEDKEKLITKEMITESALTTDYAAIKELKM